MFLQSTFYSRGYCRDCETARKIERKGMNHLVHIILTVISSGLYAIIYASYAIGWYCIIKHRSVFWSCVHCGGNNVVNDKDKEADRSGIPEMFIKNINVE